MWWIEFEDTYTSIIKRGDYYYFKDNEGWIYINNPISM